MKIEDYSFGSIKVDGARYSSDLIVFPDHISPDWWRKEGHSLAVEDLREVLNYKPETLVIGKGAVGCMKVPGHTRQALESDGIEVVEAHTGKAWPIFNEKIAQGKKVVGAFHLTC